MSKRTRKIITHHDMLAGASKIKALLDAGADVDTRFEEGITPLMSAAVHGDLATVDVLLQAGANLELQQNGYGMTALMKAAMWGNTAIVTKLLQAGAQVNKATRSGWTALMYGAVSGRSEVVKVLLDYNANPALKDTDSKTALDWAKEQGEQEIIEVLENDKLS